MRLVATGPLGVHAVIPFGDLKISEQKKLRYLESLVGHKFLHNLKPPLLHRDIKPANVLAAEKTHITKLCDMGLSKLKSAL